MKNNTDSQVNICHFNGIINIYGNDKKVEKWKWTFFLTRRLFAFINGRMITQKTLYKPSIQIVVEALTCADAFYFWGHGGKNGSLKINDSEYLQISDVREVAKAREKAGKEKMAFVRLDACDTANTADAVNSWLKLTRKFTGVPGLTWYAKFGLFGYGKRFKTSSPITYDPGDNPKNEYKER